MRKLILALFLVIATSGVAFAFDQPQAIGEIKRVRGTDQAEPTRVFKLVRNFDHGQNAAQIVSGDAVTYSLSADDGVTVNISLASADATFAGIAVTNIPTGDSAVGSTVFDDIGRRNWGYILVHGPTVANVTAGGGNGATAGSSLITSTDAGRITTVPAQLGVGDRSIAIANSRGGFFYDSLASDVTSTSVEVYIEKE